MDEIILAAMVAAFLLLPASVVAYRVATAPPEEPHDPAACRSCAPLFQADPPPSIPRQRHGGES